MDLENVIGVGCSEWLERRSLLLDAGAAVLAPKAPGAAHRHAGIRPLAVVHSSEGLRLSGGIHNLDHGCQTSRFASRGDVDIGILGGRVGMGERLINKARIVDRDEVLVMLDELAFERDADIGRPDARAACDEANQDSSGNVQ